MYFAGAVEVTRRLKPWTSQQVYHRREELRHPKRRRQTGNRSGKSPGGWRKRS
jgi:hypothetical protein